MGAQICERRREHPGWGPRRIEYELRRLGVEPVPSRSAIYRCLKRHGLIELRRRRRRRDNGKVFTGRFGPHPTEVLFDRILREHGIAHRQTGIRSPTTTQRDRALPPEPASRVPRRKDLRLAGGRAGRAGCLGGRIQHLPTSRPWRWPRRRTASASPSSRPTRSRSRSTPARTIPAFNVGAALRPSYAPGELWTLMVAVRPRGRGTFGPAKGSPRQPRCYA